MNPRIVTSLGFHLQALGLPGWRKEQINAAARKRLRHLSLKPNVNDDEIDAYVKRAVRRAIREKGLLLPGTVQLADANDLPAPILINSEEFDKRDDYSHLVAVFRSILKSRDMRVRAVFRLLVRGHSAVEISRIVRIPRTTLRRLMRSEIDSLRREVLTLAKSDEIVARALECCGRRRPRQR